jgi:hypothetical protein
MSQTLDINGVLLREKDNSPIANIPIAVYTKSDEAKRYRVITNNDGKFIVKAIPFDTTIYFQIEIDNRLIVRDITVGDGETSVSAALLVPQITAKPSEEKVPWWLSDEDSTAETDGSRIVSGNKKRPPLRDGFYSGSNARVYVRAQDGSRLVELNAVTVDFTYHTPLMPIYGYKSVFANDFAVGSVLIQGTFTLNVQQSSALKQHLVKSYPNSSYGEYRYNSYPVRINRGEFSSDMPLYANIALQDTLPPLRFDIDLRYRIEFDDRVPTNKTGYRILDAQVYQVQQAVASSGEPIGEHYAFIARKIEPLED